MADSGSEARIRDLKKRLELDPGSRLFVALAEEYRKTRRPADALSTLQKGLLAHPNYLSAQVALGRAHLEAGQITEAIAAFSKTLAADPGNLLSARSLADIYLSRGESVEAIKKYKLYRALSGDRRVDEIIHRLEVELAPPPPPPTSPSGEVPPPPTFFDQNRTAAAPKSREVSSSKSSAAAGPRRPDEDEAVEMAPVPFEPDESLDRKPMEISIPGLISRDTPLLGASSTPPGHATGQESAAPQPPPKPFVPEPAAPPQPAPEASMVEPVLPPPVTALVREPEFPPPSAPQTETATASEMGLARSEPAAGAVRPQVPTSPGPQELATRAFRISEILGTPSEPDTGGGVEAGRQGDAPPGEKPRGRVLADLYYAQGHFAEALGIYDDLVASSPHDAELKRLRRDAEARLLPAAMTAGAAAPDGALARRLAKIRVLKRWLGMVQTG